MHLIQEGVDPAELETIYGGQHGPYPLPDPIVAKLFEEDEENEKPAETDAERLLREEEEAKTRQDLIKNAVIGYVVGTLGLVGAAFAFAHGFNFSFTAANFFLFNLIAAEISSIIFLGEVSGLQILEILTFLPLSFILVGSFMDQLTAFGWFEKVSLLKYLEEMSLLDSRSCLLLSASSIIFIATHSLLALRKVRMELDRLAKKGEADKLRQEKKKKRKPKIVDVSVDDHRVRIDTHGRAEYKIIVSTNDNEKYEIWKRYSDFKKLDEELTALSSITKTKKMPPKSNSMFGNDLDDTFLGTRRESLNLYLQALVRGNKELDPLLLEFLSRQ
jgi:hypothetical protein